MIPAIRRRVMFPVIVVAAFSLGVVTAQEVNPGPPNIPAGLVRAFQSIGQDIFGAAKFFVAVNPGLPDAPAPAVDVWLADNPSVPTTINVYFNPGPPNSDGLTVPRTWLRITLNGSQVTVEREVDTTIGDTDVTLVDADLSGFYPPNPNTVTR